MSRRIEKINSLIQQTFGEVIQREADLPADVLVTISGVDTTSNLRTTTISLSIYPVSRERSVLAALTKQLYHLQGALNRALHLKPLPRIILKSDHGAANAESINNKLDRLRPSN